MFFMTMSPTNGPRRDLISPKFASICEKTRIASEPEMWEKGNYA
jgi:hypothetical protein